MMEKKKGVISIADLDKEFQELNNNENERFPIEVFPESIQVLIREAEQKLNYSREYLATSILSACSLAIGASHKVKVKETWEEKVNIFAVIVGRAGDGKSHPLSFAYRPIRKREKDYFKAYEEALRLYEIDQKRPVEQREDLEKPQLKKFQLQDFTPEALTHIHYHNKRGICINVDEINGWLKNINRYNKSGEVELYLTLWSGKPICVDRKSSSSILLEDPFLNIIGTIQTSILGELTKDNNGENGFMDRILFAFANEEQSMKWKDTELDSIHIQNYERIVENLLDLSFIEDEPTILNFSDEARELLFRWQNENDEKVRECEHDYERSIHRKMEMYAIRFSLLIQLIHYGSNDMGKGCVGLSAVQKALRLIEYYRSMAFKARRIVKGGTLKGKLTEDQMTVLKSLPNEFRKAEGLEVAEKLNMNARTFSRLLKKAHLFRNTSHGHYKKI